MTNCSIYQFNAELKGYKPRMWRRFQVFGRYFFSKISIYCYDSF